MQYCIQKLHYGSETLYLPMKSFPFIYCHTFNNFANSYKKELKSNNVSKNNCL